MLLAMCLPHHRRMHGGKMRLARSVVAMLLLSGIAVGVSGTDSAARGAPPASAGAEPVVPGHPLPVRRSRPDPEGAAAARPVPAWPAAGRARLTAGTAASTLRVEAGPAVEAETLDQPAVRAVGAYGLAFRLRRTDPQNAPATVRIAANYTAFRHGSGGDVADRLRLVRMPACALARPGDPACAPVDVPARNNTATGVLQADVRAAGHDDPAAAVYALTTGLSGDAGDYRATDLRPAGKWSVGEQSGDFSYSYPVPLPPSPYGKAPDLGLNYSAQSVDGRNSATNNQASWAGMGWDLNPGYIERKYRACVDDGTNTLSDLCWYSPYSADELGAGYVISLNGTTTELIKDSAGIFHAANDPGWKIEHTYDGDNADNSKEAWVVSTPDGVRYFFGHHPDSTWTVPVVGNGSGEPCHASSPSPCRQAWRWTLDEIRDQNENLTRFSWTKETNYYKRFSTGSMESYDRGGYLNRIEYGYQEGQTPAVRVDLDAVYRCKSDITLANPDCAAPTTSSDDYPDVPVDLICGSGQSCAKEMPSFFVVRRLGSIVTKVWDPPTSSYLPVTRVQPTFAFPNPEGSMGPALWLNYLQQIGSWGENVTMPAVDFDGAYLNNRVDYPAGDTTKAMPMRRITTIQNGLGGEIHVHYGHGSPAATCPANGSDSGWESGKHWDDNAQECFRVDYKPDGGSLTHGVFQKYVVTSVDQVDAVGGSPTQTTRYDYLETPAWHYDDDLTAPADQQQWSDWRGYGKVRVTIGSGTDSSVTESVHFRGMDGDRKSGGGTKNVSIKDYDGNSFADNHAKNGQPLQEQQYQVNADGSRTEIAATRYTYWDSGVTADGPGLHNAHMVRTLGRYGRQRRADGTWRQTGAVLDGYRTGNGGLPTRQQDLGDLGTAADDTCTEVTYAQNTADWRWMLDYPETQELHSGAPDPQSDACPGPVVARTVTLYDGAAAPGVTDAPIDGNPTEVRRYSNDTSFVADKTGYDQYGRVLTKIDPMNHTTTTSYNPAVGWPVNGVKVTNPLMQATTTYGSRAFDATTTRIIDPNGLVTTTDYDGAGRIRRVWLPTERKPNGVDVPPPANAIPSYEFRYHVSTGGSAANAQPDRPSVVTTNRLQSIDAGAAAWLSTYAYLDGFGRPREQQRPSPSGSGRSVTVTTYDDRGLQRGTSAPFHDPVAAADDPALLVNPARESIPSWTEKTYDGLQRETQSALYGTGQLVARTLTANYGDGKVVTPPRGGRTAYWNDGHDKLTRIQENFPAGSDVPPAAQPPTTTLGYTPRGELGSITDAMGNVTAYTMDWIGRRTATKDPDAGRTSTGYDAAGNITYTVDGRGQRLSFSYDALNRKRAEFIGEIGGTKSAEWTYDTVPLGIGKPTASTRYVDGQPYRITVTGYDARRRVTSRTWSIPSVETGVAGNYAYGYSYDRADHLVATAYPAAAGLPAETVTTAYTATGLPATMTGSQVYVSATAYDGSGRLRVRDYGPDGGVERRYGYEETGAGHLVSIHTTAGDEVTQDDALAYDTADNVTSVADRITGQRQCFAYDGLQRLTTAYTTTATGCGGSGDGKGPDPYAIGYAYDATGNMTSAGPVAYTYPASGPTSVRPHAVSSIGTDTYRYDDAGELSGRTIDGVASTLTWNEQADLAKVSTGSATSSYGYTADGNRLLRRDSDVRTLYLEGMEVRSQGSGAATATRYYQAGGATVALRTASGVTWLLSDQQNSSTIATGDEGTSRQRYLPYGEQRGGDDIAVTDRGFLGHTEDADTGLDQVGARYYDASTGRFISPDPMFTDNAPQSLNPYAYARGNPTTYSDASGLTLDGPSCSYDCTSGVLTGGLTGGSNVCGFCGSHNPLACLPGVISYCSSLSDWLATPVRPGLDRRLLQGMVRGYRQLGYTGSDEFTRGDLLAWAKDGNIQAWDTLCQSVLDRSVADCKADPFTGDSNIYHDPTTTILRHFSISAQGCALVICVQAQVTLDGTVQVGASQGIPILDRGEMGKHTGLKSATRPGFIGGGIGFTFDTAGPAKQEPAFIYVCEYEVVGACLQGGPTTDGGIHLGIGPAVGFGWTAGAGATHNVIDGDDYRN
jgi:RHS repeat-associated protein